MPLKSLERMDQHKLYKIQVTKHPMSVGIKNTEACWSGGTCQNSFYSSHEGKIDNSALPHVS